MKCETNRELQMKLSSLVLAAALKPAFQNGIWSQLKRLRHQSQESATCCNSCIARPVSSCFRAARALRGRSMTSPWRTWDTKECIGRTHGTSEAKRMNLWNETADRIGASWERPNSTQMSKSNTNTTLEKRVRVYPNHQRSISNENFLTSKDNTMFGVQFSAPQSQISKGASRSIGASFRETKS